MHLEINGIIVSQSSYNCASEKNLIGRIMTRNLFGNTVPIFS